MTSIIACVLGGDPIRMEGLATVGKVREELGLENHAATVNGDPQDDDFELSDEDFVSFAPAVKGGTA